MKIKILLIWITLITGGSAVSAEENGKVQEKQDGLIVWSQDNRKMDFTRRVFHVRAY